MHFPIIYVAPSGIPGQITFTDVQLTRMTVQWEELPCSDRNGEITGYSIVYVSETTPSVTATSSNTRLVMEGLLPRTRYVFSVMARGASRFRNAIMFTATPTGGT